MTNTSDEWRVGPTVDNKFELLSAYIDGEATASERQQVEALLATDVDFHRQYRQMQRIGQSLPAMTVPNTHQSTDQLAAAVFAKIDGQRNRKFTWIGGTVAATLLAAVAGLSGLLGGNNSQLQFASKANMPAPLMVALNDPILLIPEGIEIPMTAPEVNADEI